MKNLIFIPLYNEEKRLNTESIIQFLNISHVVAVDDGSTDGTHQKLLGLTHLSGFKVLSSKKNLGKGNVLQWAFQEFKRDNDLSEYNWIGYWDGDFSTPVREFERMIDFSKKHQHSEVIWASRIENQEAKINRLWTRFILGRLFNLMSKIILKHDLYDTQCGAKIFSPKAAKIAFQSSFIANWPFDLEIYLRLKKEAKINILEYPVSEWSHVKGSKISLLKDGFKVLIDLLKIRLKYFK
jgi:dolichyl-phosphate beta-glucosyltransferase